MIAREYGADLFVSIHADAARNREASGSSVYCLSTGAASSEAAKILARNENLADVVGGVPNGEGSDASDPIILDMFQTHTINQSRTFGTLSPERAGRGEPSEICDRSGGAFPCAQASGDSVDTGRNRLYLQCERGKAFAERPLSDARLRRGWPVPSWSFCRPSRRRVQPFPSCKRIANLGICLLGWEKGEGKARSPTGSGDTVSKIRSTRHHTG